MRVRAVDLPCVVETYKTRDRKMYFKSGDVGQMLIVHNSEEEAQDVPLEYPSGLTPPTTNITKRRFQRTPFAQTKPVSAQAPCAHMRTHTSADMPTYAASLACRLRA